MPTIEIFLALFIFILMVLVSIEDISTGFLFLLVLMPLQHKELFSLVVWDVIPIRIAFFGIVLSTFYRFYLWFRRYKKKEVVLKFVKDPVLIFLIALYIIRVISIIFIAENKVAGLKLLAFYTTIVYFYILIKFLYQNYGFSFIKRSVWVYSLIGFITGVISIIQFFAFKIYNYKFGAIWEIPGHNPRIGSTFWDVNHFAAFISSIIPISIAFFFIQKGKEKYFWAFNTIFLSIILYLTQSRSSWLGIGLGVSFLVFFLFLKGFKRYAKSVFVLGIIGIVSLFLYFEFVGPGIVQKYKTFMHTRLDSFNTHFLLLEGSLEIYRDNPILGKGYGNFNEAFRKTSVAEDYFFREVNIINERVPSHSIWGEVAAETGFLGIFFYVLIFFTTLFLLVRGYLKSKKTESILAIGLAGSIISLLASGIFYTYNLEFFWFTIFFGTVVAYSYNKNLSFSGFFEWIIRVRGVPLFFITTFSSFFLFWDLGKNKLIDWDEAIYAEVSRNILRTGDTFTLYWYTGIPWFEKPPLYFWMSSFFMRVFGVGELGARLPSALAALGTIVVVYFFAKKLFKSRLTGFFASLMLISTAQFLYYGRMGMIDVTVSFFIATCLYFGYTYLEKRKVYLLLLSGAFCGLAILTKAIVGLLPIVVLGVYGLYLLTRTSKYSIEDFLKSISLFIFSMLLVALPWHVYMYYIHGSHFIDVYFTEHILNRGLTDQQGKTRPFFWYIEVIKVSFRAWFLVLIPSFIYTVYKAYKGHKNQVFLLIATVIIFLFFSASKSKLVWYIIPIYPFVSIINSGFILEVINFIKGYLPQKINNIRITQSVVKGLAGIALPFFILLYFVNYHKLVYYVDFNDDLVKVVDVYNERFYKDESTNKPLYYLRLPAPVVKFYSEGPVVNSSLESFEELVEEQEFTESLVYVSRGGEVKYFTEMFGNSKVEVISEEGAYYITYVRSPEEDLVAENIELRSKIRERVNNLSQKEDIEAELNEIHSLQTQLFENEQILHNRLPNKYNSPIRIYHNAQ